MKKLISAVIALALMISATATAYAYTPISQEQRVYEEFINYYSEKTGGEKPASVKVTDFYCKEPGEHPWYYEYAWGILVKFESENAKEDSSFKRVGKDGLFYERSDKTNLLFPSGYAIYISDILYEYENEDISFDRFLSLEEACEYDLISKALLKTLKPESFGVMGGEDSVSSLNINTATNIQKLIADMLMTDLDRRVYDFDNSGGVDVNDVTWLQKYIAQ